MADILIADDTRAIRSALQILLEEEGYAVRVASDGEEALAELRRCRPDLLLLDIMMPKKNGYQVLKQIRRDDPQLPVIFLSAKGSPADVALGLDLGSDDYLPKPFDNEVLVSRIKAVLRRAQPASSAPRAAGGDEEEDFEVGAHHRVDVKRLTLVGPKGREDALSMREMRFLRYLTEREGDVVRRDALLDALWGYGASVGTRILDQMVFHLRQKLGRDADCLETVHGAGYRYSRDGKER